MHGAGLDDQAGAAEDDGDVKCTCGLPRSLHHSLIDRPRGNELPTSPGLLQLTPPSREDNERCGHRQTDRDTDTETGSVISRLTPTNHRSFVRRQKTTPGALRLTAK